MAHPHGLVHQNGQVNDTPLSTLAARTALLINADFATTSATFLAKRVRYHINTTGQAAGEGPIIICLAHGNTSIAEITTALVTRNTAGPADVTQMLEQDGSWTVVQDSVEMLKESDSSGQAQSSGEWLRLGRKGIPFAEASGWTLNVFNADNAALTTGTIIKGTYQVQGVWLRD